MIKDMANQERLLIDQIIEFDNLIFANDKHALTELINHEVIPLHIGDLKNELEAFLARKKIKPSKPSKGEDPCLIS